MKLENILSETIKTKKIQYVWMLGFKSLTSRLKSI